MLVILKIGRWLLSNRIAQAILAGLAALGGIKAYAALQSHKAVKNERQRQQKVDTDNAKDIRRRVDSLPDTGKLRPDDKRGYRD